jgi:hypothetical protein
MTQPALSAEEWAQHLVKDWLLEMRLEVLFGIDFTRERSRHAIAALALHCQPFGFTEEDVRLLDGLGRDTSLLTFPVEELDSRLRSLASRISALLPPGIPVVDSGGSPSGPRVP